MSTTERTNIPAAPAHLPKPIREKWTAAYQAALENAARNTPGNERAQRIAALKAANAIQSVKPPTSLLEVDALEAWQFIRRETKEVQGVLSRVCVTIDGQKYIFPARTAAPEAALVDDEKGTGKDGKGNKGNPIGVGTQSRA